MGQSLLQTDKSGQSSLILSTGGMIQYNATASKIEATFNFTEVKENMIQHTVSLGFRATENITKLANLSSTKANFELSYVFGSNHLELFDMEQSPLWIFFSPQVSLANYNSSYTNTEIEKIEAFHYRINLHLNQLFTLCNSELLVGVAASFIPKGTNLHLYDKVNYNVPKSTTPSGIILYEERKAYFGPNPEYIRGWEIPFDLLYYPGGWFSKKARIGFGISQKYYHNTTLQQFNTSIGIFHYSRSKATTIVGVPIPAGNNPEKIVFGFFIQYSDLFDQFEITRQKSFNERLNFILSAGIPILY